MYLNETMPLIEYYQGRGKLAVIDGQQHIDKVYQDIVNVLKGEA